VGVLLALAGLLALAPPARAADQANLAVFAATSLSDAFQEAARVLQRERGWRIALNLAGSQQLAAQLEHGAAADVFASADARWMDYMRERNLLAGEARPFVRNRLVVIVPRTNPARIDRLEHLARRGVKLVLGAEAVPVGRYSRWVLDSLARAPGFPPDFARRVLRNVVSEEENVRAVVGKVQLGEADAGLVYRSDVAGSAGRHVKTIAIPDSCNVIASYPIAVLREAPNAAAAAGFVEFLLSPRGQELLERHGFLAVGSP
jgi:molybdate transport system substrate-binding protein